MKINKYKNKIKNKKIPGNQTPCYSRIPAASFVVHIGKHLPFGIIFSLGIICGGGSFAAQYRTRCIENFGFIVSERVQVNLDNSRAMSALTFLLFKLNTLLTKIVKL